MTDAARGIAWMVLAMLTFATLDATAKLLTQSYPVPMVAWMRYAVHLALMLVVLNRSVPRLLVTRRRGLQLLRSLLLLATTGFNFAALSFLPLAQTTSIFFLTPILATALSVPLLGESVGLRRWIGVAVGFVGALIVIRPDPTDLELAALLALAAALCNALYQITTRRVSGTDNARTTLLWTALTGTVVAAPVLPFFWTPPDATGWALLGLLGALGWGGHFALYKAVQAAPMATVAPFTYTALLGALFWGIVIFADWPEATTLAGAALIVGAGLYIIYREHRAGARTGPDR